MATAPSHGAIPTGDPVGAPVTSDTGALVVDDAGDPVTDGLEGDDAHMMTPGAACSAPAAGLTPTRERA